MFQRKLAHPSSVSSATMKMEAECSSGTLCQSIEFNGFTSQKTVDVCSYSCMKLRSHLM